MNELKVSAAAVERLRVARREALAATNAADVAKVLLDGVEQFLLAFVVDSPPRYAPSVDEPEPEAPHDVEAPDGLAARAVDSFARKLREELLAEFHGRADVITRNLIKLESEVETKFELFAEKYIRENEIDEYCAKLRDATRADIAAEIEKAHAAVYEKYAFKIDEVRASLEVRLGQLVAEQVAGLARRADEETQNERVAHYAAPAMAALLEHVVLPVSEGVRTQIAEQAIEMAWAMVETSRAR